MKTVIMPSVKVDLPQPKIMQVNYFDTHKEVTFEFLDKITTLEMALDDIWPRWYRIKD